MATARSETLFSRQTVIQTLTESLGWGFIDATTYRRTMEFLKTGAFKTPCTEAQFLALIEACKI